jgi:hypothetical protein
LEESGEILMDSGRKEGKTQTNKRNEEERKDSNKPMGKKGETAIKKK